MATPGNPNVVYAGTPIIGAGLNMRYNTATDTNPPPWQLGTTIVDNNNAKVWVFVHAPTGIPSNATCTIIYSALGLSVDAATVGAKTMQNYVNGTAAFAVDDYGWVQSVNRLGYNRPVANVS